jgi:DNA-binding LytR/AlgR family response regulator
MISYLIVDDEPLAHEIIEEFCGMLPHLQLKKNCYNALEAMQFLNGDTVDIMFLDLNMPRLKGFDFLKTLTNPPKVIVTTAYQEFALEGYELNVADYLLKPFSFDRMVKAINKAIAPKSETKNTTITQDKRRFFVKGDKKYHQVASDEILYIEAYGNYTKLVLKSETIISHEKISYYETLFSKEEFLRVHKSFMVALDKINLIEGNRILIEEHQIPIGQTYRSLISKLYSS